MLSVKPRIPEGGAIEDTPSYSMEEYSEYMRKKREKEYLEFIDKFLILKPKDDTTILEIGPGPGWIGIWLAKKLPNSKIVGLEPSSDMRRVASNNAVREGESNHITYVEGFVEDMRELDDSSFDAVISNDSLHHWTDPVKGLQEISRVLKKDGLVQISDNRRDLGWGGLAILHIFGRLFAGKFWKYWKSSIDAGYTPDELGEMLQKVTDHDWAVKSNLMSVSITTRTTDYHKSGTG